MDNLYLRALCGIVGNWCVRAGSHEVRRDERSVQQHGADDEDTPLHSVIIDCLTVLKLLEFFPQFPSGNLPTLVPGQCIHKVPDTRHLPWRNARREEVTQLLLRRPADDACGNAFTTSRTSIGRSKYHAVPHGGMPQQLALDDLRGDLPAGHVDEVRRAAPQVDLAGAQFDEIAREKTP